MISLKKLLSTFILILSIVFAVNAQDKKMSIGIGLGSAVLFNDPPSLYFDLEYDTDPGMVIYTNVLYNFTKRFSAGLEYHAIFPIDVFGNQPSYDLKNINGYFSKIKYSFRDEGTRLFIALMPGYYSGRYKYYSPNSNTFTKIPNEAGFGFASQFGLQINNFQITSTIHFPGTFFNSSLEIAYLILQFNVGWNFGIIKND